MPKLSMHNTYQISKFFCRLLSKIGIINYLNLYPKIKLGKKIIRLPIISGIGYEHLFPPTEPWLDNTIKILLDTREGSFVDVGVNLGQTLLKFIKYGDNRTYYGFEPNTSCYAYVQRLKDVNHLHNVTIIPVGLSDHHSLTEMFLNTEFDGAASIIDGFRPAKHYSLRKLVPVFRGDQALDYFRIVSICILKVDVEGAELEVLSGLNKTITEFKPFILCEILPVYDENSPIGKMRRKRTDKILEILSDSKYKIIQLLHDGNAVFLETIVSHSNLALRDYLFVPEDFIEPVRRRLNL